MKLDISVIAAILAVTLSAGSTVHGQSLLDELERRLSQPQRATDELPAPRQPAETSRPPADISRQPSESSRRSMLGVTVASITEEAVRRYALTVRSGALVTNLYPGSAAERAGIAVGAVVVAFDGRRIDTPDQLVSAINATPAGRSVELTYYQGNRLFRKTLQLTPGGQAANPGTTFRPRVPPTAESPGRVGPLPSLERELGRGGNRPLLGRLGRVLDELATPAGSDPPVVSPTTPQRSEDAVAALTAQVEFLRQQVELLQRRLTEVEQKLEAATRPSQ